MIAIKGEKPFSIQVAVFTYLEFKGIWVIQQPKMKEVPAGRCCLLFIIIPLEATGV